MTTPERNPIAAAILILTVVLAGALGGGWSVFGVLVVIQIAGLAHHIQWRPK